LAGFIVIGLLLRVVDTRWAFLSDELVTVFELLSSIGIITLLFAVGLQSHPRALAKKFAQRRTDLVWRRTDVPAWRICCQLLVTAH